MIKNYYWSSATYHHIFASAEERDAALQSLTIAKIKREARGCYIGIEPDAGMFLIYCINLGDIPVWAIKFLDLLLKLDPKRKSLPEVSNALRKWVPDLD